MSAATSPRRFTPIDALLQEAKTAVQQQNHHEARRLLQQAVRQDPQDYRGWLWLATVAPSPQASLEYVNRAEMLAPNNPTVHQARRWAEKRLPETALPAVTGPVPGVVISRDSEAVVLETQYAGRIKIAVEFISAIDSERFAASVTTPASVSASNVPTNTKPSDGTPSAAAKVVADQTDKPVDSTTKKTPRLFGGRYLGIADGWEGNANIGFSYTTGNSNTATLTTGIRASKAGHRDKLTVYIRNLWNTNRNAPQSTTQNAVWGGFRYDRDLKQRLFTFGSWDFERDRPKRLNFRSVIGGGLGNHTIKNDRTELDLLIGLAWNRAWQIGENNDSPESLGAVALKHKFTERLKIQNSFTFYQDLTRLKNTDSFSMRRCPQTSPSELGGISLSATDLTMTRSKSKRKRFGICFNRSAGYSRC